MSTVTARLDSWLREDLERIWKSHGEGPSTGLRRIAEEWWAMEHYSFIAFRDGVSGRRAVLRSGPDVWEVAMVARDYGDDRNALREHFGDSVSREALDQALAYAERFPEEIEAMIADNERMERLLAAPHLAR
jgi:hypothetical protein